MKSPFSRFTAWLSAPGPAGTARLAAVAGVFLILIILVSVGLSTLKPADTKEDAKPDAPKAQAQKPAPLRLDPTFDIVRVDRRGTDVIAGRAVPGAKVAAKIGDKVIGSAVATAKGEWVITVDQPLEPGNQEIYLEATLADGRVIRSVQSVVVIVPARDAQGSDPPLVVLSQPGEASRVLQGPAGEMAAGDLSLDSVDYDAKGALILSGKAKAGATIRPYLNNESLGVTKSGTTGRWTLTPDRVVKPGTYTLRIDELAADGKVVQRLELPFERASVEALAAAGAAGGNVIVQPGNSLWRIARRVYGGGESYTTIYQANSAAIKDPNLIYPGQVLALPGH